MVCPITIRFRSIFSWHFVWDSGFFNPVEVTTEYHKNSANCQNTIQGPLSYFVFFELQSDVINRGVDLCRARLVEMNIRTSKNGSAWQ